MMVRVFKFFSSVIILMIAHFIHEDFFIYALRTKLFSASGGD